MTISWIRFITRAANYGCLAFLLSFAPRVFGSVELANQTREPDPNSVTVLAIGIIDEINDPSEALSDKVVSIGSEFVCSITFKPTDELLHHGLYETMPGSWNVSFGSVTASTSGAAVVTHYDETFDEILWLQNTGIGNADDGTPIKPFSEVSGMPFFTTLTGTSMSFATTSHPFPYTISDTIDETYLSSFKFKNFYARISRPWAPSSTLAEIHGTIVEIVVLGQNSSGLTFKYDIR